MGLLYEAKRDTKGARRSFERVLELEPGSALGLAGLVSADLAEKNPRSALARVTSELAKHPNDPKLVQMSGMVYMAVSDLPKAEAAYRKLLELDANSMDAYNGLGTIYMSQNRLDEARKSFEEMAKRPGTQVAAETMLGTILVRQNKMSEARGRFERAVQLDPRNGQAQLALAQALTRTGDARGAFQAASLAAELLPSDLEAREALADAHWLAGQETAAFEEFRALVNEVHGADRDRVVSKARTLYRRRAGFLGRLIAGIGPLFELAFDNGWLELGR